MSCHFAVAWIWGAGPVGLGVEWSQPTARASAACSLPVRCAAAPEREQNLLCDKQLSPGGGGIGAVDRQLSQDPGTRTADQSVTGSMYRLAGAA